jgi:tetratricopeptide (TPR) repeat protein
MLSLICFIKANEKRPLFWFILHNVAYIFALFTKESMIVLPLIFYSYYFLFIRIQNKKIIKYIISWSIITVAWFIIRSNIVNNLPALNEWNIFDVIQKIIFSSIFNIGKIIVPINLKIIPALTNSSIYPSLLIFLLLISSVLIFGLKGRKLILFGFVLLISILIIPTVSMPENPIQNENRLYIPLIGILIILSQIDFGSKLRNLPHYLLPLFIFALISGFTFRSFSWAKVYKEPFVYTGVLVLQSPNDPQSYFIRAGFFLNKNMYIVAIADYTKAIELDPDWRQIAGVYYNRGVCYSKMGLFEKAMEDFKRSLDLNPSHYRSYIGVGFVYYDLGDFESAIQNMTQSIKINSSAYYTNINEAYLIRAMAHAKIGDYINSFKDYNKAVEIDPSNMKNYNNRYILLSEISNDSTAIENLNELIANNENMILGYYCLGLAYFGKEEYDTALEFFNKSIELNPQFEDVYNMRGLTYYNLEQYSSSQLDFNKAIEMNSYNYHIYNFRAKTLFELKHYEEALDDLNYAIGIGGRADTTLINNIENVLFTDN